MAKKLIIHRQSSFVACAMPYRILVDHIERGRVSNGSTTVIEVPDTSFLLTIDMVGNGISFNALKGFAEIDPSKSTSDNIQCFIQTKPNITGILTFGIMKSIGTITVNVLMN